jgi:adenylate kinase
MQLQQHRNQVGAVVLLGLPGSGKGTQAGKLAEELGVPAVSTGELLRREAGRSTPLGESVREVMASGKLVSDELVTRVLAAHLCASRFRNGFVLDGYPRTVAQAELLDEWLTNRGFGLPRVVYLDVSCEEVAARLASRLTCPLCGYTYSTASDLAARGGTCEKDGTLLVHRSDDNDTSILERFRQYEVNTKPLLAYYESRDLRRVAAAGSPEEVFMRVLGALAEQKNVSAGMPKRRDILVAV